MKSKAALAKALREKGLPVLEDDSAVAMQHRLDTWIPGNGFLFRRMKVRRFAQKVFPEGAKDIPMGSVVWIPNSEFARTLFRTKAMWFLGRKPYDASYTLLDVPGMPEEKPVAEPKAEPKKAAPKKKAPAKKKSAAVKKGGGDDKSDS